MIDFHNHILPNVDDGSKSLEMSLNMLKEAERQGITDIVNTVHYQHPKVEGKDISFERITQEIENLQKSAFESNINVKIYNGAEVFYLPNLLELIDNPQATIGNGKYMLIEFPIFQFPPNYEKTLFELSMKGVTPIIAHPERYTVIQNDIIELASLVQRGCLVQIDAGSIIGTFGANAQKISHQILKNGLCHIIGSDSHNDSTRNICLKEAISVCANHLGMDISEMVIDNPKKILNGEIFEPEIDLDYLINKKTTIWMQVKSAFFNV